VKGSNTLDSAWPSTVQGAMKLVLSETSVGWVVAAKVLSCLCLAEEGIALFAIPFTNGISISS